MIDLRHVDCLEYMATLPDKTFQLAIVDPPYTDNTDNLSNYVNKMRGNGYALRTLTGAPGPAYFAELQRVSVNQVVWGGNYFPFLWAKPSRGFIFWYKHNPVPNFADGEMAWTSYDRNAQCFNFPYGRGGIEGKTIGPRGGKIHPTQKPIALYRWLLKNYAKPGDRILDTHLGSGSSAIAADIEGFDFVGCELDADYIQGARKRLADHQAQPRLFEPPKADPGEQLALA